VSFAAITLCVASQRVFIVVYFVIDSCSLHKKYKKYSQIIYILQNGYIFRILWLNSRSKYTNVGSKECEFNVVK
jgi:hypothetical protein